MIQVGILGLGPVWEARYRPALENLSRRIRVCAIHDPVATRAEIAAAAFGADLAVGVRELLDRRQVRAVLLLDSGWYADRPLRWICQRGMPAYVAGSLGSDRGALRRLHAIAESCSLTLMPEFSRRFTPATGRLQELMATRLGRPTRIEVSARQPDPAQTPAVPGQGAGVDFLVGLLDWCGYIARTPSRSVRAESDADGRQSLTIEFRRPRSGGEPVTAVLRLSHSIEADDEGAPFTAHVLCQRGEATLTGRETIRWTSGAEGASESLTSERSEVEVMLDHFCRRVAGGLVPVADVADVCRALELARAADESLTRGAAVDLPQER